MVAKPAHSWAGVRFSSFPSHQNSLDVLLATPDYPVLCMQLPTYLIPNKIFSSHPMLPLIFLSQKPLPEDN